MFSMEKTDLRQYFKKDFPMDLFLGLFLILITGVFFNSPGTYDTWLFREWMDHAAEFGIRHGYAANHDMYPPLTIIPQVLLQRMGTSDYEALRIVNSFCLLFSTLLIRVLHRTRGGALLMFFTMLFCQACGYLDITTVPFMLLAFYFLKEEKYELSGLFMALFCLMKYQPLVIMPYLLVYFLTFTGKKLDIRWNQLLRFGWPVAILVALTFLIFGKAPYDALNRGFGVWSGTLSCNALNLGWILSYVLQRFFPQIDGGLAGGGLIRMMYNSAPDSFLATKYIFWIIFVVLLLLMLPCKKSYRLFLQFALMEYSAYSLFNVGVHENHIILSALLAVALYLEERTEESFIQAVIYSLMANTNIILFYGFTGEGFVPGRSVFSVDISLPLSVLYILFYLYSSGKMIARILREDMNPDFSLPFLKKAS